MKFKDYLVRVEVNDQVHALVCLGQDDKLFFCLNEFKDYFGRTILFELKDNDFILHGCFFEQFV